MKSYLSLIPISARVRKKQNRLTLICIILAVFLVTAVFSMADMGVRAEKMNMIAKHGNWHISLHKVDENTADNIFAQSNIAAASWYDAINYRIDKDYYINGKKTAVCGVDKPYVTDISVSDFEGDFPQNAQEVMLTSNARDILGIQTGDNITVNTPMGDMNYTVSGFKYDDSAVFYDAIVTFMNKEGFETFCSVTGSGDSYSEYYIRFKKFTNVQKAIAGIKEEYNLTGENIAENTAVMGLEGFSSNSYMFGLYGIAAFLVFLVLLAGILMISSSMNSNVAQRTQFFGMLRCVGASKNQIVRFVRLEALNWCKTAIPTGIAAACVITWGLCAFLRYGIGGEFENMPLFSVSSVGIICGVVIGILTVLIAAQSPAKRAARTSPIAAVSGNADTVNNVRRGANTRFGKTETALGWPRSLTAARPCNLGIHHAVSSKKNLVLMTLSFAVSIIMFLGFSSMLGFIEHALPSLRGYTPDVAITNMDGSCSIDRGLYNEIYGSHGVKNVYGNMFGLHTPVISDRTDEVDLISYDDYMLNWSENNALLDGDLSNILGDSSYAFTIHNKESTLRKGDKIQIGDEEIEIMGELSTGVWSDGKATVICSEETFTRLTGKSDYTMLCVKLSKDAAESDITFLRNLAGENSFIDYRETNRQNRGTYWLFSILVYGFLAIIAMITVFNIMNNISMSVSAKIKQYGAMRAIGMDSAQLTKMIAAEAVTYACSGCIIGSAAGIPLNKWFFETMVTSHFGNPWTFPVRAIIVILVLVAMSCILAVYAPSKRIRGMAITDIINEL
ncbi:MAG: ABC transporter permease [Oscillospiraceae bacterium]|nr:ABC transporter permease [Oscillospiraceae bacterium]